MTGVYHVMLRGVNRDAIFLDDQDCHRFLNALRLVKRHSGCAVLAYCLMPNHVHLVLRTDGEPIGLVMKRLGVRYAAWFNRRYGRVGHVFQDRFQSRPVEDDSYFITLVRYLWNNPVRAGLAPQPLDYRWNSGAETLPDGLVDESELDALLPSLSRPDLTVALPEPDRPKGPAGRRRIHTESEVAQLLLRSCGAGSPEEFSRLAPNVQLRAIAELRTQSVAYAAIAQATGLSRPRVQRIHASGWTVQVPSAGEQEWEPSPIVAHRG